MKISPVSTNAVSQALRLQVARAQAEMIKAQTEVVTGQVADRGLHTGIRTGQSVSLDRDIARLGNIKDTNALASSRMSASQEAMSQIQGYATKFMSTLTTSLGGALHPDVLQAEASTMLSTMASAANTSIAGEFIFAGTNTDVKPLDDFLSPNSTLRPAIDQLFNDFRGTTDPQDLTPAQIGDFLDILDDFMSDTVPSPWSNANDQGITSRIALNQTAQTSVTVNEIGIRQFVTAAAAVLVLSEAGVANDAMQTVSNRALAWTSGGMTQMTASQATLGIVEERIANASERLKMQIDIFTNMQRDMIGVDEYEAGTRLTALMAQADAALLLTTRIQQISLLKYLS